MRSSGRLQVTYVTAERCHFCERGHEVLKQLADRFPMDVRTVDLISDEGRDVAARWQVPFPPVVLVNGVLVAYGRLSPRRLAQELEGLTTSAEALGA